MPGVIGRTECRAVNLVEIFTMRSNGKLNPSRPLRVTLMAAGAPPEGAELLHQALGSAGALPRRGTACPSTTARWKTRSSNCSGPFQLPVPPVHRHKSGYRQAFVSQL